MWSARHSYRDLKCSSRTRSGTPQDSSGEPPLFLAAELKMSVLNAAVIARDLAVELLYCYLTGVNEIYLWRPHAYRKDKACLLALPQIRACVLQAFQIDNSFTSPRSFILYSFRLRIGPQALFYIKGNGVSLFLLLRLIKV